MISNIPASTAAVVERVLTARRHPGLQLDKFSSAVNQEGQKQALDHVVTCKGDGQLLVTLLEGRKRLLDAVGAAEWSGVTTGPLTLHLARASALENAGICLHPMYGFTYLPGSGLKGMARAYAEAVWLKEQPERYVAWEQIENVFGWAPNRDRAGQILDDKHPAVERMAPTTDGRDVIVDACVGGVVFHDAWPHKWPQLDVDIVNNHHPAYYGAPWGESAEPGDWENPVPVYFLCARPGTTYSFAVSPRSSGAADASLRLAQEWLRGALTWLGAGAKTAAGYGRFAFAEGQAVAAPKALDTHETTVELVTPAFLAGANQVAADCDLRSASLRGVLRSWWRTIHADAVKPRQLRELESAIWGSTESGGAVQVLVQAESAVKPELYAIKDRNALDRSFAAKHSLGGSGSGRTPGLLYLSYGMDDGKTHRYYMPPGASWRVRLVTRDTTFVASRNSDNGAPSAEVHLDANVVLDQARAALWLLRHFGGVGAKSRKGFGSLDADEGVDLQWCIQAGAELRRSCGLNPSPTVAYSAHCLAEIKLPAADCWWVLQELGFAVQGFASARKHDPKKEALGLPRKIHGPTDRPLGHQKTHEHPVWLGAHHPMLAGRSPANMRHAAPVYYHVARAADGTHCVRVVAFPHRFLPDIATSRAILQEVVSSVSRDLTASACNVPAGARRHAQAGGASLDAPPRISGQDKQSTQPQPQPKPPAPRIIPAKSPGEEFFDWFDSQKFSSANKGRHDSIRRKIESLPTDDLRSQAKAAVREKLKKNDTTPSLCAYLNS